MLGKADPKNDAAGKKNIKGHHTTQGFKSSSLDCRGMEIYLKYSTDEEDGDGEI